jgi:acetyl-CoA decarbonylase/synthase complex subunit gamma
MLGRIPGRAFAFKGGLVGGLLSGLFITLFSPPPAQGLFIAGVVIAASSFLAMNFTGATTFTSLSGVRKEMRYALPVQIGLACIAVVGRVLLETVLKGGPGV